MTFEETYLNDNILDALYDMHFEEMTPIQEQCIPKILDGQDLIGVAQLEQEKLQPICCLSSVCSTTVVSLRMPLTA